jgi:hypothetical protein
MTAAQIEALTKRRSNPLTSRTAWALYVAQASLHLFLWRVVSAIEAGATLPAEITIGGFCAIVALGITGIGGLAWTDDAVSVVRALRGVPEPAPKVSP